MESALKKHYAYIRHILILILLLNWGVALAKIIYGLITRCASMTADGFHSLSDGVSNIIGIAGIHFACQPRDKDHPYGHKKYETFFSLGIAALLFILAFNLLKGGISRIYHPITPRIDTTSFVIMITTVIINLWVMRFEHKKGKTLKSDILTSDALHTKADIFTSLSVIITLIVVRLGWTLLDPITTILVSLFIARAGYDIIKHSSAVLCDTAAILDEKKIRDVVLRIKEVRACHKIRTRGRADDIHIDLHAQVDKDMPIENAHKISYAIEETIKRSIPSVTDVVVHMEPR